MKDQRSIDAVNVAERFGLDECSFEELNAAAAAADYASAAKVKNQKETSIICKNILGDLLIEKFKNLQL
jgi:hypothetical protein